MKPTDYKTLPAWRMLLRAAALMLAILLAFFVLTDLLDRMDVFEVDTALGEDVTEVGHMLRTAKLNWINAAGGVLFFMLVQWGLFPFFSLRDVVFGVGRYDKSGEDSIRAALILGWFLSLAAVLVAFS